MKKLTKQFLLHKLPQFKFSIERFFIILILLGIPLNLYKNSFRMVIDINGLILCRRICKEGITRRDCSSYIKQIFHIPNFINLGGKYICHNLLALLLINFRGFFERSFFTITFNGSCPDI